MTRAKNDTGQCYQSQLKSTARAQLQIINYNNQQRVDEKMCQIDVIVLVGFAQFFSDGSILNVDWVERQNLKFHVAWPIFKWMDG